MGRGDGMDSTASVPRAKSPDLVVTSMPWWLYLITATAWLIIAWVVLRFDLTSVGAVAVLAGVVVLMAAVAELFNAFTMPGWRWLHGLLGALFLVTGFVCLFNPGSTFAWLAAFIGWYLLFKGAFDIVMAFMTREESETWWLSLVVGIIEVILGFWAAGRFGRSVALLIVFVGAIALTRAITDIILAFRLRKLQHGDSPGLTRGGMTPPGGVVAGTA